MTTVTRFLACGWAACLLVTAAPAGAQDVKERLPFDASIARLGPAAAGPLISEKERIYFGKVTPDGAFPFMVALINARAKNTQEDMYKAQYCGGSLIKDNWVLTAAHCMVRVENDKLRLLQPGEVDVYVGSNNFRGGTRIKVKRILVHRDYNHARTDSDVALMELAAPASGNRIGLVSYVTPTNERDVSAPGKPVIAAGWGEIETGDYPVNLRHVELDIIDAAACNTGMVRHHVRQIGQVLAELGERIELKEPVIREVQALLEKNAGRVITDNMICSGKLRARQDSCQGDSGGPLFTRLPNGRFVQVGITSWGIGCGRGDRDELYGVYTRVAKFAPWIEQNAK